MHARQLARSTRIRMSRIGSLVATTATGLSPGQRTQRTGTEKWRWKVAGNMRCNAFNRGRHSGLCDLWWLAAKSVVTRFVSMLFSICLYSPCWLYREVYYKTSRVIRSVSTKLHHNDIPSATPPFYVLGRGK